MGCSVAHSLNKPEPLFSYLIVNILRVAFTESNNFTFDRIQSVAYLNDPDQHRTLELRPLRGSLGSHRALKRFRLTSFVHQSYCETVSLLRNISYANILIIFYKR